MSWIIVGVAIALLLGALVAVFVSVIFVKKGSETEWQESIAAQPDPTFSPTVTPTESPTESMAPSSKPSFSPSAQPSTYPTSSTLPSSMPSSSPSVSAEPSSQPSMSPSVSSKPSHQPSSMPSSTPTLSASPSSQPSLQPTITSSPSSEPSQNPTVSPSNVPSAQPTVSTAPSSWPSYAPSTSTMPSSVPTSIIVLNGQQSTEGNKMAIVGGAYVFALATVGLYLYRKNKRGKKRPDESDVSVIDVEEGGILGIAPRPLDETTPRKSVSRRMLSSMRSLSPFKSFSLRKEKNLSAIVHGTSNLSISSGDGEDIPAVQDSCSTFSSKTKDTEERKFNSSDDSDDLPAVQDSCSTFSSESIDADESKSNSSDDSDDLPAVQNSCSTFSSETIGADESKSNSSDDFNEIPTVQESCSTLSSETKESGSIHSLCSTISSETKYIEETRDSFDMFQEPFSPRCKTFTKEISANASGSDCVKKESMKSACELDQILSASNNRLAYEEELVNSSNNSDFNFRDVFFDPENVIYECRVPSGRLGIVVDETGIGPRVKSVNAMSKLNGKISVGDIIIALDEVDLVGASPDTFWQLVSRKSSKQERCLVVLKI